MNDSDYGYVYCMMSRLNNYCKIGHVHTADKTSHDRARELFTTSIPERFDVIFDIKVKNPMYYEKIIHKKLDKYRINKNREFFNCNPDDIKEYFLMENLIENEIQKNDFFKDYFVEYIDNNKIIVARKDVNKDNKVVNKDVNKNIKHISSTKCDICYTKFKTNYLLTKHKNKKESCVYERINLVYDEISELKKFIREKDKCVDSKDHKCIYCKNNYTTKGTLKNHILTICKLRQKFINQYDEYNKEIIKLNEFKNKLESHNESNHADNDDNLNDDDDNNDDYKNLDNKTLRNMIKTLTIQVIKLSKQIDKNN
jgi:hypothetical protein